MSVNVTPLADRVLVEAAAAEEKTASGIIIPDTAKEKPQRGTVVAVGSGKKDEPLTVKVGDQVSVSVRRLDWERNRIVLSLREAANNPWNDIDELNGGEAYKGKVTRVESYGAFVEIEEGIDCLDKFRFLSQNQLKLFPFRRG